MTTLRERPEARWAFWAGIAGAIVATVLQVKGILSSTSSTAALGFIFLPLVTIVAGVMVGIWGLALGHVVARVRGAVRGTRILFISALVAAAALPAAVGYETWRGLTLERTVGEVHAMNTQQLERAFEQSHWKGDKYFLGALAQNPAASPALLDRIAALDDPALFEPGGSLWDVMGKNPAGHAVMRLVAHHRNTSASTLVRLEAHPQAAKVIHEVLANPNTPTALLEKHAADEDHLAQWGLALNPKAPRAVLERLSRSPNLYTRMNLTYNQATPTDVLERLAKDPDPSLSRSARQALAGR